MQVRGNMILWSVFHILAGLLVWFIYQITKLDYVYVLAIVLLPLLAYKIWFERTHKYDEREIAILTRVFANAGIATVVILSAGYEHVMSSFVPFLWALYLFARGAYGLFYFTRD